MKYKRLLLAFILLDFSVKASGQAIDNALSYKNIDEKSYFRLNYENDVFSGTDVYYTQGIHLELVSPDFNSFAPANLLLRLTNASIRTGISVEHDGYTPTSISSDTILRGDRPFAACLFLKLFRISVDSVRCTRLSSALSAGIMGQAAGGMEMQTGIHRWLHDITPHGWQYQVHNDAIINYQVDIEKQLLGWGRVLSIDVSGMCRAGTLSDKVAAGSTLIAGYFKSPFKRSVSWSLINAYIYDHPEIGLVGYDATLQGGIFNHTSPYVIRSADISRLTFGNRFGIVVVYRKLYLEYFQSYLTSEFKSGQYHVWGGVQVAFGL